MDFAEYLRTLRSKAQQGPRHPSFAESIYNVRDLAAAANPNLKVNLTELLPKLSELRRTQRVLGTETGQYTTPQTFVQELMGLLPQLVGRVKPLPK
jgi:hypothetical protein